jgi:hypothetical protein
MTNFSYLASAFMLGSPFASGDDTWVPIRSLKGSKEKKAGGARGNEGTPTKAKSGRDVNVVNPAESYQQHYLVRVSGLGKEDFKCPTTAFLC